MWRSLRVGLVCGLVGVIGTAWAAPDVMRFVVTGDSRGTDNGINSAILSELVPAIIAEAPDLVLFGGDLTSNGTQAQLEYWVQTFMDPLGAAGIPVYPCRGNHDASIDAWNTVFSGVHALPGNGPSGEVNRTYSFTFENALFVLLDNELPYRVNQAWLDEQFAGVSVPHVFVCNHYPAFVVDHTDCLASYPVARDAFWDSIGRAGGRTYFTGHDHFYNHSRIADGNGGRIEQYIVGTAGAPLYDWSGTYPDPAVQGLAHYKSEGYLLVEVEGFDVRLTFKQRVAPGQYEATNDTFTYLGAFRGEGVPASSTMGVAAAGLLIVLIYAARRYSTC